MEGQDMRETIQDRVNTWFVENRNPESGDYPDFPEEDGGGSKIILNPPIIEEPEPEDPAAAKKGKGKEDKKEKGKKGKGKKKKGDDDAGGEVKEDACPVYFVKGIEGSVQVLPFVHLLSCFVN
jgi:hypothetical protein